MSEIRYFNDAGREQWRQWIEDVKGQSDKPFPVALLTNGDCTRRAPGGSEIGNRIFVTKFALAETLAPLVGKLRAARLPAVYWPGVWDWLAAAHFDSICPPLPNGARKLNDLVRYSFNPAWNRKYRHRIFGPVDLYSRLGNYSRLLIHGEPSSLTDWEEQTASRYQISGNVGVAEALFRLYWDDKKQAPKRGAAPNKKTPGTLRRFGDLVQQFDRTFDLLSINAEAILDLLPKEFAPFLK
jgi:hypothetical protein